MKKRQRLFTVLIGVAVLFATFSFWFYNAFFAPTTLLEDVSDETNQYIYIPEGMQFHDLRKQLESKKIIHDGFTFAFVAKVMGYQENVKPGRYLIEPQMNNKDLISMLRLPSNSTENITFNNVRTKEDLTEKICGNLQTREDEFYTLLSDDTYLKELGFTSENVFAMFVPNTYEVYWSSTPKELMEKMKGEYDKFWTEERVKQAEAKGLTALQVSTLASIVEEEAKFDEEKPRIAGVYVNRLKKGMLLQADPTIKYALYKLDVTAQAAGDTTVNPEENFLIKRILNKHIEKAADSPYSTYASTNLPPGPIRVPEVSSLKAVLEAEGHDYLYFCAKEDFSGKHNFAKTLTQHNRNAAKYHKALNANKIR